MFTVNKDLCIGCSLCVKDCFVSDITLEDGKAEIKNLRCFKCGHCVGICPTAAISTDEYPMEDVVDYSPDTFKVEASTLLNFIKFSRTIRQFKKDVVEEEKIKMIIEAGRFTQTGSNLQNVNYVVVRENLQKLREITLHTLDKKGDEIIAKSTNPLYKRYGKMWKKMYSDFLENPNGVDNLFFHAPLVILVTSESIVNASLASTNMKMMVEALGLGTVFSGFLVKASEDSSEIKDFLGIDSKESIVTCMVIGYPSIKFRRTVPRKPANISWK